MPGDWVKGENRTLESSRENQAEWWEKGRGNRARLMVMEFEALFIPYRPDWQGPLLPTSILAKIPPPPLHSFCLGPVNHLVDHLGQLYPELEQHLVNLHLVREDYHEKTFEGECYKCSLDLTLGLIILLHWSHMFALL